MKRWTLVTTATLLAAILSAPGFAANSKCANPVGSVEQRACAMAASGPDALRHFIERTRGIYNLYYWDFAPAER
jgi:hypothetical protein